MLAEALFGKAVPWARDQCAKYSAIRLPRPDEIQAIIRSMDDYLEPRNSPLPSHGAFFTRDKRHMTNAS